MAESAIKAVYPKAKISGQSKSPKYFEVLITKSDKSQKLVFSKISGDGEFEEYCIEPMIKKIKGFVETKN